MTEKIKSVVLATGRQKFAGSETLDYVLAYNEQWGEFVMNPRNVVNYYNEPIINFKIDMSKFIGCKRKDELICSRSKPKKGQYMYTIEVYLTLERIKDRFVEKENKKENDDALKFAGSDKTSRFMRDYVRTKMAEQQSQQTL